MAYNGLSCCVEMHYHKKITSKGVGGVSESVQKQVHTIDYQCQNETHTHILKEKFCEI